MTRNASAVDLPREADVVDGSFSALPIGLFDDVSAAFVFPADGAADFARAAGSVDRLVQVEPPSVERHSPCDRPPR